MQEVLGGFADKLQTDYFGKGDTSTYDRSTWAAAAAPQSTFHKYTWTWTESQIIWSIDGEPVRTLPYAEAKGGTRFPQTPMQIRIGIWAGGDPSNSQGTITWAGGLTEYSQAPFTMYVKSVHIDNYNPAKSYSYSDHSGSSKSIKLDGAVPKDHSSSTSESSSSTPSSSSTSSSSSTTSSSATSLSTTNSSLTYTNLAGKSTGSDTTTTGHTSTGTSTGSSSQTTVSSLGSSDPKETDSQSTPTEASNHNVPMSPHANHTAANTPASAAAAEPTITKPNTSMGFTLNEVRLLLLFVFFMVLLS